MANRRPFRFLAAAGPDNGISGNKVIGKGRLPTNNPITIALRMAATTLRKSKTYLGAQFRRLRSRLGAPIAINAMAAKLARLVYRMLCYGMKYVDQGTAVYEAQHRQLQIQAAQVESRQAGIPDRPSSRRLKSRSSEVSEEPNMEGKPTDRELSSRKLLFGFAAGCTTVDPSARVR